MKRSVARNWQGACKAWRPGRLEGGGGGGGEAAGTVGTSAGTSVLL